METRIILSVVSLIHKILVAFCVEHSQAVGFLEPKLPKFFRCTIEFQAITAIFNNPSAKIKDTGLFLNINK